MNHGRPSKIEQDQLQQKLRKYFDYGVTATLTAQKTQTNIKTVCKYFDEWSNSIAELRAKEYFETEKIIRARCIATYDNQIIEIIELLEDINGEMQKLRDDKKSIPRYMFSTKLEIQKFLLDVTERKITLDLQMTPKEMIEKSINDELKEKFPYAFKDSSDLYQNKLLEGS